MFKSKEDLKEEFYPKGSQPKDDHDFQINVNVCRAIDKAFSSIAERKKIYEDYKDKKPTKRYDNDNMIYNGYMGYIEIMRLKNTDKVWLNWLFHFCFDGVK